MFSVEQSAVPFQELHKKSASERKLSLMSRGERGITKAIIRRQPFHFI